jgi:hypothetical protein
MDLRVIGHLFLIDGLLWHEAGAVLVAQIIIKYAAVFHQGIRRLI